MLGPVLALCLVASACSSSSDTQASLDDGPQFGDSLDEYFNASAPDSPDSSPTPEGFAEIEWEDLVPPGSSTAEISARFDERIAELEPGSAEADAMYAELQAEQENQPANPAIQNEDILLKGFVAPLAYSGELITEFLLVPYFGACIHVPPPPPNQTVLVTLAEGQELTFDESWGAVWVAGTMTIDSAETELATAAYSITGAQSGVHADY